MLEAVEPLPAFVVGPWLDLLAWKFQIASKEGMVVVCNGPCETAKGTVKAVDVSEQSLTRAIRQAVSSKKKVYFVQGHGEVDPDESKGSGGSGVKGGLEDENATVAKLVLASEEDVPVDADALIIAGPTSVPTASSTLLDAYLKRGGSFLMVDPDHRRTSRASSRSGASPRAWR